ncbi:MAG: PEP/pyruvate-binding domain-containing protein [Anaerolineales bacterium]|nr:PEP/pyruvate-binding domain-containing protein [Anaerolineales bacterium]
MSCPEDTLIAWFGEIDRGDVSIAGGKGASLSDMARAGLPVPPGFVICTGAFEQFLRESRLAGEIERRMQGLNVEDSAMLERLAEEITQIIEAQQPSENLRAMIVSAYQKLCADYGDLAIVAVRSSAAAEDSQVASFAGQQETFLNIYGEDCVVNQVRACWSSFFKPRAIFYRGQKGNLKDTSMAVVVQRMVNPDKSGVMFTADPVQRRRDRVMIEAAWGLGEAVVSGLVTPDNYVVNKTDGRLVSKFISRKTVMIIREDNGIGVRQVDLPPEKAQAQVLTSEEIAQLADLGNLIEKHFGCPQDVEWAIEGNSLYVLQSRPVTTL